MIRSIGVFLSFCLASTLLRIPPFGLNNIQEFMIYIMGLTAFHIVLCAALIGPRRIFREILESEKVIQWAHGGALLCGPLAFRWTTAVRPSFSGAECASLRPGRGGAGRRGPRDRRVAAEHVT